MTKIDELDYLLDTALRRLNDDKAGAKRAIEDAKKKLANLISPQKPTEGVNPVTLRGVTTRKGTEKVNFSIGRLGVGLPGEEEMLVTFVAWKGDDNKPEMLANMVIGEGKVIEALKLLFNKGELNDHWLHTWLSARSPV